MIKSPLIIIGCPRSGTTLLYNILSEVPVLWSIGYESKAIIERYHHPSKKSWESGVLDDRDITPQSREYMLAAFSQQSAPGTYWKQVNRFRRWLSSNLLYRSVKKQSRSKGTSGVVSSAIPQQGLNVIRTMIGLRNAISHLNRKATIRLLEKTPENCLRLSFLLSLFPDARVLYLIRDGRANINSLMEGWQQPHLFPGYRVPIEIRIPGDTRGRWAFTLIPGWRSLISSPLEEVCAWQWIRCNEAVLTHREQTMNRVPYLIIRYEDMIAKPSMTFQQIADFAGLDFNSSFRDLTKGLPQVNVVSGPDQDKWRKKNRDAIQRITPIIQPMMERLGYDLSS